MANNNRRNKLVVPGSNDAINRMKNEIAAELGVPNYDSIDKGDLPARLHGAIGGTITKRLIEIGQQALANNGQVDLSKSGLNVQEYRQDMIKDMQSGQGTISAEEAGSRNFQ